MLNRRRFCTLKTAVTSVYKTARGHIPDDLSPSGELNSMSVCVFNESPYLGEVDGMNVWLWAVIIFTKGED